MPRIPMSIPDHHKMLYRSHPWHGIPLGDESPFVVNCYIEIVPTDTIKYELDKETGILKVDRPQKYSSLCPTLYGFLPQTYAGNLVGRYCTQKMGNQQEILGDGDPVDICVLTEKCIPRGDLLLRARPIGGFRLIDGDQADDKIISVLMGDFVYGEMKDIHECPNALIERLRHYFLTYKASPERLNSRVQITHTYNAAEAREIINLSREDYRAKFAGLLNS
ncbi:Inorganic pyrophosphatase [Chlamydiales bacterium STE3]|nr:Inorganic pyrophosphatase [Chlamydiales bacterium STE3]